MQTFKSTDLLEGVPLGPKTTIQLGGPARYYYQATHEGSLWGAICWARAQGLPIFVLGGGSNTLIADEGFPGLVVDLACQGLFWTEEVNQVRVKAAAGEAWDALVAEAVARNLAGIECLSGIPGRVGAAPIQNIGAYGQEVADVLTRVSALDLESGATVDLTPADCGFGYRTSIFKHGPLKDRYVVLGIELVLVPGGRGSVNYPDLRHRLGEHASLAEIRETVLAVRREKSMVQDRSDPNAWSCGSFFTNPILDEVAYLAFCERVGMDHPRYPAPGGSTKLSAAWLIQHAGFEKGLQAGGVGLSEKHCLALINRGSGTAAEIKALAARIQAGVLARFGVHLEPEPVFIP